MATLNGLLGVQAKVAVRFGGDIDKFVGDQLMVVFQGPDRASRALDCALRMVSAVEEAGAALPHTMSVGVGVHDGLVLLGAVGSDRRRDYTAVGDAVNVAARRAAWAGSRQVLVSGVVSGAIDADKGRVEEPRWRDAQGTTGRGPCLPSDVRGDTAGGPNGVIRIGQDPVARQAAARTGLSVGPPAPTCLADLPRYRTHRAPPHPARSP